MRNVMPAVPGIERQHAIQCLNPALWMVICSAKSASRMARSTITHRACTLSRMRAIRRWERS